ncbi:hypothetical protein ACOMD2_08110 [Hominicoprocola fusiformis]
MRKASCEAPLRRVLCGYSCIAVSLYDRYNDDHYAITLSSLKSLMTDEHIQQLLPLLFETRDLIQKDIGL